MAPIIIKPAEELFSSTWSVWAHPKLAHNDKKNMPPNFLIKFEYNVNY